MMFHKGDIEYVAAVLDGNQEFQETNSEVSVTVPCQARGVLFQKIHTEFSLFRGIIPEEECMISPVAEIHTSACSELPSGKMQYKIRIPHSLKVQEHLDLIKVRRGDIHADIPFTELRRKSEVQDTLPCYEVQERFIIIYTDHFSQFVCSACGKPCNSYIMAFPFGTLIQEDEDEVTEVTVKVYLCCSLYNIEDFRTVCTNYFMLMYVLNDRSICLSVLDLKD